MTQDEFETLLETIMEQKELVVATLLEDVFDRLFDTEDSQAGGTTQKMVMLDKLRNQTRKYRQSLEK